MNAGRPTFSVVIPSARAENLIPCVRAVMAHEPELPSQCIVVVDDGSRSQAEPALPPVASAGAEIDYKLALVGDPRALRADCVLSAETVSGDQRGCIDLHRSCRRGAAV